MSARCTPWMRRALYEQVCAGAVAVLMGAGVASTEPLPGMGRSTADDNGNSGRIRVDRCGAQICGTLVKAFGPNGKEIKPDNIGLKLISETVNRGGGEYRGKTCNSRLNLSGDTLQVNGCVPGICRNGGSWKKVP